MAGVASSPEFDGSVVKHGTVRRSEVGMMCTVTSSSMLESLEELSSLLGSG